MEMRRLTSEMPRMTPDFIFILLLARLIGTQVGVP